MKEVLYNDRFASGQKTIATFRQERRIRRVDTDASGFAKLDCYLRLMEETEYSFLRSRGLSVVLSDNKGIIGFPRLTAQVSVMNPVKFDTLVVIRFDLVDVDGKRMKYQFQITNPNSNSGSNWMVATGLFRVACCRFPTGKWPYAILTPDDVIEKLTGAPQTN